MEITEAVLDKLEKRIIRLPEIDSSHESFVMLEQADDNELFFKFMSDGGITDGINGRALHKLLEASNIPHEYFDHRKFFVDADVLDKFLQSREVK